MHVNLAAWIKSAWKNEKVSVPEFKRDIEQLPVITKGRAFVARTVRICGNEKYFAKRLRWDFTHTIPSLAVDLYACCRKANRVRVECPGDAQMRLGFWKEALSDADALMGLIDLCTDLSQLPLSKVQSWSADLDEIQRLIEGRIKSDKRRYLPYEQG